MIVPTNFSNDEGASIHAQDHDDKGKDGDENARGEKTGDFGLIATGRRRKTEGIRYDDRNGILDASWGEDGWVLSVLVVRDVAYGSRALGEGPCVS